jgi:hypothetical protein
MALPEHCPAGETAMALNSPPRWRDGGMGNASPMLPGCARMVILLTFVVIGTGVVQGVTDALHTLVHGGAALVQASR